MKNQKGFTLIELLLVLAIIGIISAIAIPAMLGQRARARDKSAIQGTIGRVGELVGMYDHAKEQLAAGVAGSSLTQLINASLASTIGTKDLNPWGGGQGGTASDLIFSSAINVSLTGNTTKGAFDAAMQAAAAGATGVIGQGVGYLQAPTATDPGFVGVGVKLKDGTAQIKSVAVE